MYEQLVSGKADSARAVQFLSSDGPCLTYISHRVSWILLDTFGGLFIQTSKIPGFQRDKSPSRGVISKKKIVDDWLNLAWQANQHRVAKAETGDTHKI